MKKFAKFFLLAALVAVPFVGNAQSQDDALKSNTELSEKYKHQIDALEAELKANKSHQKADPTNADLKKVEQEKKAELATLKAKKKTVDSAIKSEKANVKAQKQHEKATQNADKAEQKAKDKASAASKMVGADLEGKSFEQLSEQYKYKIDAINAELKANKSHQKADPANAELKKIEQEKKAELATLKAKKKSVDEAINAAKSNVKAQKTQDKKEAAAGKALEKAKTQAEAADKAVGR